jgi:hypothetical protein
MARWRNKQNDLGFDPLPLLSGKWAWQMTPVGGARGVMLVDGMKWDVVKPADPAIAGMTDEIPDCGFANQREYWVNGLKEGVTFALARDPVTRAEVKLSIQVYERRTIKAGFYRVKDPADSSRTGIDGATAKRICEDYHELDAHTILCDQSNIGLKFVDSKDVELSLGAKVDAEANFPRFKEIVNKNLITADFHVFLIWGDPQTKDGPGAALTYSSYRNICVFGDQMLTKHMPATLAHETGHYLGLEDLMHSDGSNLMSTKEGQTLSLIGKVNLDKMKVGIHLDKDQIETMRKGAP